MQNNKKTTTKNIEGKIHMQSQNKTPTILCNQKEEKTTRKQHK